MRSWNLFIGSLGKLGHWNDGLRWTKGFRLEMMPFLSSIPWMSWIPREHWKVFGILDSLEQLHHSTALCDLFHLRMVMVIASLALSAPMVPWSGGTMSQRKQHRTYLDITSDHLISHISYITSVLIKDDLPHRYFMLPQKILFFRWVPPCFRGKDAGMAQCVPCAPGTANPLTGMTACIPCLVGRGMGFLLGRPGFESLDVDVEPLDDECWCWMMNADVGWCWMTNDDVGWCWMMNDDVGWCWMMNDDVGWWMLMLDDECWCWMMNADVGWCWMVLDDVGWWMLMLDGVGWCWMMLDDECWCWMMLDGVGCCWMVLDDVGWWMLMLDDVGWCWMMMDDAGWWMMMLDDVGWCWMMNADVGWCWMMLDDECWCWMMNADVGWCWMMNVDVGWCWMMNVDVGWWMLMLDDVGWWMLMLDDECWCWMIQITFRSLSRLSDGNWNSGLVGRAFHEHLWSTAVWAVPRGFLWQPLAKRLWGWLTVHGWCVHGFSPQRESKVSNF